MGSCLSSDGSGGGGSSRSSSSAPSSPLLSPGSKKGRSGGGTGRRRRPGGSSLDSEQQHLHKIPGRMFLNGASSVASLFTQQGKKGTNQDAMIVWENFGSRADTVFCGVFDGHGPYGHMVARRVRDSLPLKLSAHLEVNIESHDFVRENNISATGSPTSEDTVLAFLGDESRNSVDPQEKERPPEIFTTLKESFLKAFKVMDKELKLHPSIDCFCSGTTAVTLVKQGHDLVIGNVGDSRAVLGTRDQNGSLISVQLTVDLKPNLPKEEERIRQCRGRVFALRDEPEVARVWLPHNDSPGLAMARAFGDFCLKDFGLISEPEISYRRLTEKDEFVVLATDGVWDVLSNKEVVDIVASAPSRSSAARSLVELAVRAWRYKYPTSKVDDCAVVCLFLSNNSDDEAAASINDISSNSIGNEKHEGGSLSALGAVGSNDWNKQQELSSPKTASDRLDTQLAEIVPGESNRKGKGKGGEFPKGQANAGPGSHHQTPSDGNTISVVDGDEWSALEGVSRVNTMITLPRFTVAEEKKIASLKLKKLV